MHCKTNYGSLGKNEGSDINQLPTNKFALNRADLRSRVAPQRCPLSSMTLQRYDELRKTELQFLTFEL